MITRQDGTEYGWDSDGIESTRLTGTYSTYHARLDRLERIGTLPETVLRLLDRLARWGVILEAHRARRRHAAFLKLYRITPESQAALAERGRAASRYQDE